MEKKKQVIGRKLKKVTLQPQEKMIPSSSSNARLGVQSSSKQMETPSDLPLPLMALFKVMILMPGDENILIPVDDATFGLPVENIYVSKEEVFQFLG